jgi:putative transposase
MLLGFKTKLKLNNQQKTLMAQHAGYGRWVFNWGLKAWNETYKEGLKPTANKLKKFYTNYVKPDYPWQSQLSSRVYQYAFQDLDNSFKRFFKIKGTGYPKFKKKGINDSFTLDNCGKWIPLGSTRIKLPFIGFVSTYEPIPECQVKKVTLTKVGEDWFISFAYEQQRPITSKKSDLVGVDLGIKTLATLSNGEVFPNLKPYRKAAQKLGRLQRKLSRKVKGSKNRNKARIKLAKQHQKVANLRRDYLHKITCYLAKNFSEIVIEDLNVSGMLANRKSRSVARNEAITKAISELGFYEFRRQLEYKCELYGSKLTIVDRWFPSSKTCSGCGAIKGELSLSDRIYSCECGLEIDRDLNAAKVLASKAVGYTVLACGQSAADGSD